MTRWIEWRGFSWIALPLRLYIGSVFLWACWHKILHPATFALDVATYQILPLYFVNAFALILPWVELAAGVMIIVGWRTKAAALLIAGMMALFIAAVSIVLAKGLEVSCGCFASQAMEEDPITIMTLLRDIGWFAIPLYVLLFDKNPIGIDGLAEYLKRRSRRPLYP